MKNRFQILALALASVQASATDLGTPSTIDTTKYITFDAESKGGELQLIDANTKKIEGITNFDGNKLDPGRYIAIDGVRALFESANGLTVHTALWDKDALAALKNSELVIYQGTEIFNIPASEIFNLHRGMATTNEADYRDISHIPVIKPDSVFKITWKFPNGGGVPANADGTALVRLEFRCHEVTFTK